MYYLNLNLFKVITHTQTKKLETCPGNKIQVAVNVAKYVLCLSGPFFIQQII